MTHWLQHFI